MFIGHFAAGIAIKAIRPKTPTLPIMLGIGLMDIFDGIFIMIGLNKVAPNLNAGPYLFFDLTFIDWDHSLLMALVISALWGLLFIKNKETALIAALACFSHFILDWPMHNNDLALYPYSAEHLGYGLWGKLGIGSWIFEGILAAALVAFSWKKFKEFGGSLKWVALLMALMFVNLSPWLSPMKEVAQFPEPKASIIHGALVALGFLVPSLIFTYLINRETKKSKSL